MYNERICFIEPKRFDKLLKKKHIAYCASNKPLSRTMNSQGILQILTQSFIYLILLQIEELRHKCNRSQGK